MHVSGPARLLLPCCVMPALGHTAKRMQRAALHGVLTWICKVG